MAGETITDRTVLAITGADRAKFLGGLVTRDAPAGGLAYSALLTPQGKYLADFFLLDRGDDILLDVKSDIAPALLQRLTLYRLRADVTIGQTDIVVTRGRLGPMPVGAYADPRDASLGWRAYGMPGRAPIINWDELRVAACIPETGIELIANDTYILEAGFDRLMGVDHKKGCYVGQEVTARMKHKTELRKGLVTVQIKGTAPIGTDIMAGDRPAGVIYTQANGQAIAYLRFDRAKGAPLTAGQAQITWAGA